MDIVKSSLAGVPVLQVKEEVDHSVADEFADAIAESLDNRGRLLLDLGHCDYMDSGGLAVMISAIRDLPDGGWIRVVGANKNLSRLFEIVGLAVNASFSMYEDLSEAEKSL